jgi:hypothetical protein
MDDNARGGNDTLIGGVSTVSLIYGDAEEMHDDAHGGNDMLTGGASAANLIYGDADTMDGDSRGGDDTLIGAGVVIGGIFDPVNRLHGDATSMSGNARGGNDTLIAGDSSENYLFGDARFMFGGSRGGNDTLISGTGIDHMWGDAEFINGLVASPTADTGSVKTGADTFVFAPGNGNDDIGDFRQSDHDKIDVSAYGFHNLAQMMITFTGTDTTIAFDATNSVTLVGFASPLHESDFLLAS